MRWYIGTLLFILSFVAVVNQQQDTVPNQVLVLEFTGSKITLSETQSTVSVVKDRLQDLGAENIRVTEEANSRLRITYHSDVDVNHIKNALSEDNTLVFNYPIDGQGKTGSRFPLEDNRVSCNLDIYEIQKNNGSSSGFGAIPVLTINHKSERLNVLDVYRFNNYLDDNITNTIKVTYKVHYTIVLSIEEPFHITPEVRAGPFC
ncbi:hypothetical protein [Aestuariivivens marinum]|uniref:hypothetical protein n=1 Tax=Aestuariivivens marinum TaxID=2913555 RepID=UPI001F589221|nr:hypothetical protein [Aestuariivivens marinum]